MSVEDHEELSGWFYSETTSLVLPDGFARVSLVIAATRPASPQELAASSPLTYGERLVARMLGSAGPGLSTDEIMALTRGD